ncbi:hypothetical protein L596_018620 [Steinernema carpocapsae]|uniref:Uncharacterized protein n=1 Tax=Steinernema carpocapsae TaxID=34508 RepID=A0A4U5N5F2_STECR|nr:hypothetical protein L596_018620 [Steinernema carpocapsae]
MSAVDVPEEVLGKVRNAEERETTILKLGEAERKVLKHNEFTLFEFEVAEEFQKIGVLVECVAQSDSDKFRVVLFDENDTPEFIDYSTPCVGSSQSIVPFGPFGQIEISKPIYNKTSIRHRIPDSCLKLFTMRQNVELPAKRRRLLAVVAGNRIRNLDFRIRVLPLRFVSLDAVTELLAVDKKLITKKKELDVYVDFNSWESIRASGDEIRDLLTERWQRCQGLRDSCVRHIVCD